ncbi:hypothetical protein NBRC111893_1752 [Lentilactobacillus kosonis]|uniref:Glycerol kinase n=1 Tax=Lentilactobacillus kosonis TaxID=2810561 RepID=A0A401FMR2_9LACO|nr:hypothetical protein NBRC111893_1752 [Lentilactobacillus kosonis]
MAVGFWQDFDEIRELVHPDTEFYPNIDDEKRQLLYDGWKDAVWATQEFSKHHSHNFNS